jgi:hypothetical protein
MRPQCAPPARRATPRCATPQTAPRPARSLVADSVFGRSGESSGPPAREPAAAARSSHCSSQLFGDSAASEPGVYALPDSAAPRPLSLITLLPFDSKKPVAFGSYRIGYWPGERARGALAVAMPNPTASSA